MKQYQPFIALFCLSLAAKGQQPIDELVNAEKSFAALSRSGTTQAAFVKYFDSSSIVFRDGSIFNGRQAWINRKQDSSLLIWEPEFAVVSASGDFGFTLGPSDYRTDRSASAESNYGHFASLWHKNTNGDWKVLCDIGTSYESAYPAVKDISAVTLSLIDNTIATVIRPTEKEQQLFDALKAGEKLTDIFSENAWPLQEGKQPVKGAVLQNRLLSSSIKNMQFTYVSDWVSPTKDMFVAYGRTMADGRKGNYLTAWINENNSWKLILLVLK